MGNPHVEGSRPEANQIKSLKSIKSINQSNIRIYYRQATIDGIRDFVTSMPGYLGTTVHHAVALGQESYGSGLA